MADKRKGLSIMAKPDYRVFTVRDTKDGGGFWTAVGSAWNSKDGEGLQIKLDALPVNGELVLRKPKAGEEGESES